MKRNDSIRIGIVGGAGYTGGELLRLLIHHPFASVSFIHSRTHAGKPVASVHQDLLGETSLQFTDSIGEEIDVLFLCVGHGEARKFLADHSINEGIRIIDLSQDFRLAENREMPARKFVYGLPELNRQQIASAFNIANPGCFATAIQLGLLPLAKAGLLENVYTTGITGSTGAGQGLSATSHFSWRANNIQAYKTLTHQHVAEIEESLRSFTKKRISVHFIPWRGDFTRGIFISSQIDYEGKIEDAIELYTQFYSGHPFTAISPDVIFLKQVVNTNKCVIQLEKIGNKLVIHSALDNLLKGASGQAVQNMNIMMGADECASLNLKASYF